MSSRFRSGRPTTLPVGPSPPKDGSSQAFAFPHGPCAAEEELPVAPYVAHSVEADLLGGSSGKNPIQIR
ncbi:MAG: hypothetical protein BLITH_0523 [Brockia lithotrophica]|uniref:Uncharacterized protein n=1 Tax=Brockia lithotrophica TaxID=933949 RepID=A0A2T5G4J8_9BACL|nr:MAG: hypothetical protein BLITH_0523 [Brockia lithotrophica]